MGRALFLFLLAACLGRAGALTVTLDQARIKTVGGVQDGAWNLWSDGDWGDYVAIKSPGAYRLDVEAKGSFAMGVGPMMAVTVDGAAVASLEVKTTELKAFTFPLTLDAGVHRIAVEYSNDTKTDTEDRNLYVKRMTLTAAAGEPDPALGSDSAWTADWASQEAAKEQGALEEADAAIEKTRKEDALVTVKDAAGQPVAGASIQVELIRHEFLFGGNIFGFDTLDNAADNATYKERFAELFNFATTGFYWSAYEKEPGQANYAYTDRVVAWCREHGIAVKGHPLLWGAPFGIAPWIHGLPSPEQQQKRITEVVGRYRGGIGYWEVVNEPSDFPLLKIDDPYRWAHDVDPDAQLIVNDYNVMSYGNPSFFALLQQAIASGVPFNGIGIQAHEPENMRFPLRSVRDTLAHYATLGKDLYITEFTPESSGAPFVGEIGTPSGKVWDEAAQADYAVKFYTMCFANPAVKGVTWWDLCDPVSWRKNGGLLRADLSPKPSYLALKQLIHETWSTRAEGSTDASGGYAFRGFRGTYAVTVNWKGKSSRQEFTLGRDAKTATVVVR